MGGSEQERESGNGDAQLFGRTGQRGRWMGMEMGTRTRDEEGRGQTECGRQQTTTTTKGKGMMGWDGTVGIVT